MCSLETIKVLNSFYLHEHILHQLQILKEVEGLAAPENK